MPRLSPDAAVQALLDLGILKKPNLCPKCNQGTLQGPWPRHDAKESEQRYWVCDVSWCYTNVLTGSGGFAKKFQRFRALSPPKFYQLLLVYFTPGVVRLQQCVRASGLNRDACAHAMKSLRSLEAGAGRAQIENDSVKLQGRIECDATSIRKIYVKKNSEWWKEHIAEWQSKRPQAKKKHIQVLYPCSYIYQSCHKFTRLNLIHCCNTTDFACSQVTQKHC